MRAWLSNVFRPFAAPPPQAEPAAAPAQGEVGWSESVMFGPSDFPRYNPDELIGRQGFKIYKKIARDEQVKAVYKFRRDSITARDFYFELETEELPEDERDRRIAVFEKAIENMQGSFTDALNGVMTGMLNGFSMTEKVYEQFSFDGATWWGLEKLVKRAFETFWFFEDEHGNITKIEQRVGMRRQEIDPAKFIHYVHNPEEDRHFGLSELREAHRSWFYKDAAWKYWMIWLERNASGLVIATPEQGKNVAANSAEMTTVRQVMAAIQTKTFIIMPSGWKTEVHHPESNTNYELVLIACDKGIAKALLVPNLIGISEQGQTGSYSQSAVQFKAYVLTLVADTKRLEDTLNEQLFRDLGELNWGDGLYPKIRFRPLSKDELLKILETWKNLVSVGAVEATDAEQDLIRDMLDMPPAGKPLKKAAPALPPGSQPPPFGTPPQQEDPNAEDPNAEDPTPVGDGGGDPAEKDVAPATGKLSRFTAAMKRVDFTAIDRQSAGMQVRGVRGIGGTMGALISDLVAKIEADKLGTPEGDVKGITTLRWNGKLIGKLKQSCKAVLNEGWGLGRDQANAEIKSAVQGTQFSKAPRRINFAALEDQAAAFFEARAFQMAGRLTDDALKIVQNVLANGIKGSKTTQEIIDDIYTQLASAGFLEQDAAKEHLGELLDVEAPDARLQTVVRTNLFEAINEARYDFFTDPALNGFVEALEYSAILDGRTTDLCESLDGQVYPADSPIWDSYRPPNHFNCRSTLIAVTQQDEWSESGPPTLDPAKGFA